MTNPAASPAASPAAPSRGDTGCGAPGVSVIIGVADVTEPRRERRLRLRVLQINKKARTHVAKRAKKPKTEMTAIAQWGKDESSLPFCTLPVGLPVGEEDKLEVESPVEDEGDELEDVEPV